MDVDKIFFLADMHLKPGAQKEQNGRLARFFDFAAKPGVKFVLLGDAFNCWFERGGRHVGDYAEVMDIFSKAAQSGAEIHYVSGNRDFVVGSCGESSGYAGYFLDNEKSVLCGCGIIPNGFSYELECADGSFLCIHGDALCTRDVWYQRLRRFFYGGAGRFLLRNIPFFMADIIVGYIQRNRVHVSDYMPKDYQGIVSSAALPMMEQGSAKVVCGHVHYGEKIGFDVNGKAGELVIVPPWEDGFYGELCGKEIEFREFADSGGT